MKGTARFYLMAREMETKEEREQQPALVFTKEKITHASKATAVRNNGSKNDQLLRLPDLMELILLCDLTS